MLILTGPQGSGNHLWSKIFSLHQEVYGWKTLLDNYWEAHRFAEPFARHWRDHTLLKSFDWTQSEYYFTSISVPLGIPGDTVNPIWEPNVSNFVQAVHDQGVDVQLAVIGRDQTILKYQQTRIRKTPTLPLLEQQLNAMGHDSTIFLSYELLYLYKQIYLQSLVLPIHIPIAWNDPRIEDILSDDANVKYIHSVEHNPLDNGNKYGTTFKTRP